MEEEYKNKNVEAVHSEDKLEVFPQKLSTPVSSEAKRRRLLDTPSSLSNLSSRSESPLSLDSSRSGTPTSSVSRVERSSSELWKAIGSIDNFLLDKGIIEACKSTEGDLTGDEEDLAGTLNVSFAEFLQQYRELTDWLNQVHKVTQREVNSLSEKYLNQSYHEEMLERSPRREFLNNYSKQLLVRYPNMSEQICARMARLNSQWAAVEQAIAPKHGSHDVQSMLQDLECDLSTLRRWLNAVEAKLVTLTIHPNWTDKDFESQLATHQSLQRDIESHNKIVNAVLKLSERLEKDGSSCSNSLQKVALNLERRWHGIWLQSLEWQCRLEEALGNKKGNQHQGFEFGNYSLSVIDEALFNSNQEIDDQGLIQLDDDSLLFVGRRDDASDGPLSAVEDRYLSSSAEQSFLSHASERGLSISGENIGPREDSQLSGGESTDIDESEKPFGLLSPSFYSTLNKPESPLGKRPFPGVGSGEASPAKRGSPTFSSSSEGLSPGYSENPLYVQSPAIPILDSLKVKKTLFYKSSSDSANISEAESKMGDSPVVIENMNQANLYRGNDTTNSENEVRQNYPTNSDGEREAPIRQKSDIRDVGYSSESQSNDEVEIMRHQIDLEYKYPGKCEVAKDGPLGEKVMFPSVAVRPDYYCMTHVDIDSTDNGGTTDSGADKCEKKDQFQQSVDEVLSEMDEDNRNNSNSNQPIDSLSLPPGHFNANEVLPKGFNSSFYSHEDYVDEQVNLRPIHQILDQSESDSAPESKEKKSVKYLIDHAEDLILSPPRSSEASPNKKSGSSQSPNQTASPSKQTQTDSCSTVESSCDASGEDNSDTEKVDNTTLTFSTKEDISDDAEGTLFNSVINLDTACESSRNIRNDSNSISSSKFKISEIYDSPRLRKQTGNNKRSKKDRPWSVVGLQDIQVKKTENLSQIAASESAIDYIHADNVSLYNSSTFPRDSSSRKDFIRSFSTNEKTSSSNTSRRRLRYPSSGSSTPYPVFSSSPINQTQLSHDLHDEAFTPSPIKPTTSVTRSSPKRSYRGKKHKKDKRESVKDTRSSSDTYDSAEAESESETTDEYHTAPMEAATSDCEDPHNVSGSLSENSSWDHYQMIYPTASEDPGEELLTWEPQEDLEFDDDFVLAHTRKSSIVKDVMQTKKHAKLKLNKTGVSCEDSDSDIEDFHHVLENSELQLKLADQSLKKKRKDPMSTGLHPNPAKYGDIMKTCKTNKECLETVCQHLNSDDVTHADVQRIQELMYQWEKLHALATERHQQTSSLSEIRERLDSMTAIVQQANELLSFDKFSSKKGLRLGLSQLKAMGEKLEKQVEKVDEIKTCLVKLSTLHPTVCLDKYQQETDAVLTSTRSVAERLRQQQDHMTNNMAVWEEYVESQDQLDCLLAEDRERLYTLLSRREHGLAITKKDVLQELETLQSNLSMYESKLSLLQSMRAKLTQTTDDKTQRLFLASIAGLRNQLCVMSKRCAHLYSHLEDDQELPDDHTDLGQLAMSAAALHDALKSDRFGQSAEKAVTDESVLETKFSLSRSSASWLRSLPVQVVALLMVAGLAYVIEPDVLDKLTNFSLTITPELNYVNGPPTM